MRKRAYVTIYAQAVSPCGRYLAVCDSYGLVSVFQLSAAISVNTVEDTRKPILSFEAYEDTPCYTMITGNIFCINFKLDIRFEYYQKVIGSIENWNWSNVLRCNDNCSDPTCGGGGRRRNYILKRVFFVQSILADRYIRRREM